MCFLAYRKTSSGFFPAHQPSLWFACARVFVALVLQQTPLFKSRSHLTSFQLANAACQALMSDVQKEELVLKVAHYVWLLIFYLGLAMEE